MKKLVPISEKRIDEVSGASKVEFWVVTTATEYSRLDDICYKTNPLSFAREFLGGLKESQVLEILPVDQEARAKKVGEAEIRRMDKQKKDDKA
jgi:hypothetical protein